MWTIKFSMFSFAGQRKWGQPLPQQRWDECGGGCYGIHSRCKWGHVPANQSSDTGILGIEVSAPACWNSNTGCLFVFCLKFETFKIMVFFFFSFFLLPLSLSHSFPTSPCPHRLRAMIHLSTCWPVSGVQVANMPALLPEPWGWRLSSYTSKADSLCFRVVMCVRERAVFTYNMFGCNVCFCVADTAACCRPTVWL